MAVSPDGKTILFGVRYDGQRGPTKREWHLIDASGENNRKLDLPETFHPEGFTEDGEGLYGSLEIDKKGQLGIIFESGKPTQIISLPNGLHGTAISPDGTKFAVLADPRAADPLNDVRRVAENEPTSSYVVNVINGRDGSWWCPDLKDVNECAWSSDSTHLAVLTQVQKIGHHDVTSAIYLCSDSRTKKIADIGNAASGIALDQWWRRPHLRHHHGCPHSRSSLDRFRGERGTR